MVFIIKKSGNRGTMLITVIVATALFLISLLGGVSLALLEQKLNIRKVADTQALYIAEAGVNYYRWVLYHKRKEYCNNEPCKPGPTYGPYGPYEYTDQSDKINGYYELYIIPPAINGSTIVTIRSVGWVENFPNNKRTIEVQCGIPAWSTYSTLVNEGYSYSTGSEIWGPIHSNVQIKMDGVAHNTVTAYELTSNIVEGNNEWGVYTHSGTDDPHPNTVPPLRADVFIAGRKYGPTNVQQISFAPLSNYANEMYALATSSGLVFDPRPAGTADIYSVPAWRGCIASTQCTQGFSMELRSNNIIRVRGVRTVYGTCGYTSPAVCGTANNAVNPSWSYNTRSAYTDYTIPANGIVFVKGNTWVEGTLDNGSVGSRITILAFTENFANNNNTNIIINNDINQTLTDGRDSIGLIAQRDVLIGLRSENNLNIDAALIATNGCRRRLQYETGNSAACGSDAYGSYRSRDTVTIHGSTASKLKPYLSTYDNRDYKYDSNLTYSPPPSYPTTGEYTFISWSEK